MELHNAIVSKRNRIYRWSSTFFDEQGSICGYHHHRVTGDLKFDSDRSFALLVVQKESLQETLYKEPQLQGFQGPGKIHKEARTKANWSG